ncbi:flagellar type III secretion system pore protein FliP [soil metagenome]
MRMESLVGVLVLLAVLCGASTAVAQTVAPEGVTPEARLDPLPSAAPTIGPSMGLPDLTKRETFSSAMQIIILLTVLSLAPSILIMTTSFTRLIIVLSLLRQALGTQSLPPNQVMVGLALFMTFLIMGPTLTRVNNEALQPYMSGQIEQQDALARAQVPVREFMEGQIMAANNEADVLLFTEFAHKDAPQKWEDVSTLTLIPAFMLSELKTAFLLGFKVYLPFLIIDMVISSVLISMGMMMLPPVLISLPFKLLLFVLVDGWHLITGSLMGSFNV